MNPKPYFTAILILAVILLSGFSGHAQNSSDTIRVVSKGLGNTYYKDQTELSKEQLMKLLKTNKEAAALMDKSNDLRAGCYIFSFLGGGCLGFSLGYALGGFVGGKGANWSILAPTLIAGTASVIIGISFGITANWRAKDAIEVYNNSIKQKNSATLNLGCSANGMMLRLSF